VIAPPLSTDHAVRERVVASHPPATEWSGKS
jgi:hypothetical protein